MSKIFFQGTFGAYSHLAALSIDPKAEIIPCKTFDECFSKAQKDEKLKIIIPESNKTTGNIGIEYLIFKYRLNIYAEHFHRIEHNLLGIHGTKISDIKNVFSKVIEQSITSSSLANMKEDYIFEVIEPASINNNPTSPNRQIIFMIATFLTFISILLFRLLSYIRTIL